jgi:hypothetical protein
MRMKISALQNLYFGEKHIFYITQLKDDPAQAKIALVWVCRRTQIRITHFVNINAVFQLLPLAETGGLNS